MPGLVWFGLVWFGLFVCLFVGLLVCWFVGLLVCWLGLAWLGLVWLGLVWFGLAWFGLVWFDFLMTDFGQHLFSSSTRKDSCSIFGISEGRGSLKSLNASFSVSEFHSFQRVFFGCTF